MIINVSKRNYERYRLQFTEHYIDYIVFPSYLQFLYFIVLVKRYLFDFFTWVWLFKRKINIRSYAKEKELVLYDLKKQVRFKRRLPKI